MADKTKDTSDATAEQELAKTAAANAKDAEGADKASLADKIAAQAEATKNEKLAGVQGSPVTAGTKDNDLGNAGTNATEGNKSPDKVPGVEKKADATDNTDNHPAEAEHTITEAEADELDAKFELGTASIAKVNRLLDVMPPDSPDGLVIYGYGGVILTKGDLKNILGRV